MVLDAIKVHRHIRNGVSGMAVACRVTNGIDSEEGEPRGWLACIAFLVTRQLLAGSGLREAVFVRTLTVGLYLEHTL
jgi:hypothetical protein